MWLHLVRKFATNLLVLCMAFLVAYIACKAKKKDLLYIKKNLKDQQTEPSNNTALHPLTLSIRCGAKHTAL